MPSEHMGQTTILLVVVVGSTHGDSTAVTDGTESTYRSPVVALIYESSGKAVVRLSLVVHRSFKAGSCLPTPLML